MFSATVMVGNSAYDWKTMPTPRRRGGTSLTTRSPNRISPASGRSKPAIMRSVVVLPQPEPPTSETSSPGWMSRESPSTATAPPKRFVRRSRPIRTLPRVLLEPALHEPVLVLRIPRLFEVDVDQVHLGEFRAAQGDVPTGHLGAPPLGVRRHRRRGDRPVEEAPRVLRILGALHERIALEGPRNPVRRIDHVDPGALLLRHLDLVAERHPDGRLARHRHAPRRAARLGHLREVLVERVVVLPQLVLTEPGRVARQEQVRRARGRGWTSRCGPCTGRPAGRPRRAAA